MPRAAGCRKLLRHPHTAIYPKLAGAVFATIGLTNAKARFLLACISKHIVSAQEYKRKQKKQNAGVRQSQAQGLEVSAVAGRKKLRDSEECLESLRSLVDGDRGGREEEAEVGSRREAEGEVVPRDVITQPSLEYSNKKFLSQQKDRIVDFKSAAREHGTSTSRNSGCRCLRSSALMDS